MFDGTKTKTCTFDIDEINLKISKLPPLKNDSTICWTCKHACECTIEKIRTLGHGFVKEIGKNGIKIIACPVYERDCVGIYELCKILGISHATYSHNKQLFQPIIDKLNYRLDRSNKEEGD